MYSMYLKIFSCQCIVYGPTMECAKLRMGCVLCWCNQSFLWGPGSVNNHQLRPGPGDYFTRHLSHFDDL